MKAKVNEFAIKIGTANGTGSASANSLIMQSIFRMGIPVTGKNLFPSNIQGLPTWYEIRVNHKGYTARTPDFDLMVAMNPATYEEDIAEVRPAGWLLYDSTWPLDPKLKREDIQYLGVPFAQMCSEAFAGVRERILMKNIAYAGALAALLDIDEQVLESLAVEKYSKREALLNSNRKAIELGYNYAKEHLECPLPIRLERMDATKDCILIDGNTACALGALYAGATVAAWYPITPATSLMDAFRGFCAKYRNDPETGKRNYAIIQAEDELAAIGMVLGASWAGARAFTSTAGPGVSLMNEFLGLSYYGEIPAVVFNVQRTGPSTGMPTRTQQSDLLMCAYASHGDTKHICVYPSDPKEAFEMAVAAFDLAERFQTTVFVITDLDIGMNDWMVPKLEWDDSYRPDRGKVLSKKDLEEAESFFRYLDVDGDGIPYRSLPGVHSKGAYFTRGSGHNKYARYTEDAEEYQEVMDRIARKTALAATQVPQPHVRGTGSKIGLISIGGCHSACREAMDILNEQGIHVDYMRIRGFPFDNRVKQFLNDHDRIFVAEQNRDAQLRSLLAIETGTPRDKMEPILYYAGYPMSAHHVLKGLKSAVEVHA